VGQEAEVADMPHRFLVVLLVMLLMPCRPWRNKFRVVSLGFPMVIPSNFLLPATNKSKSGWPRD